MRLQSVCGLITLACGMAMNGCGMPVITADDVVMSPGQSARFVTSLDRQYGKTGVSGAEVQFLVNGKPVGTATTDEIGMATLRTEIREPASTYQVRATVAGQTLEGRGRIFQWDANRTAVAIDIDETLSQTDYGSLFLTELDNSSPHIEYSPSAVQAMYPHYGIVYLSARPRWLHEKTRVWLDAHGFPPGPILHASRFEACWNQERYKRDMLAEFKREFPNLLIGVGDKGVDERAYGANQMLTVILETGSRGYQDHCVVLPEWRKVEEFFIQHRSSLADAGRLRGIIHANNMQLRSFFEIAPADTGTALAAAEAAPPAHAPAVRSEDTRAKSGDGRLTRGLPLAAIGYTVTNKVYDK